MRQGILSRSDAFDGNSYGISKVQDIATQLQPKSFWLNVQVNYYVIKFLAVFQFFVAVKDLSLL